MNQRTINESTNHQPENKPETTPFSNRLKGKEEQIWTYTIKTTTFMQPLKNFVTKTTRLALISNFSSSKKL
jgi:hypothetical protein